jgi:hypothetical protein
MCYRRCPLKFGAGTQVLNSNGLNPHNLIWNPKSPNANFGSNVTLSGTVISNTHSMNSVVFGVGSSINGAVLINGDLTANGAMHPNFWPFTAALIRGGGINHSSAEVG